MPLLDGIIGCWSPSLGATGYRLLDQTAYRNHGTLTNMDAATDWVAKPPRGLCLDFDGTNDHVNFGTQVNLGGAKYATFSAWIKPVGLTDLFPMTRYNTSLGAGNIRADYFSSNTVTLSGQITLFVGSPASTTSYLQYYSTERVTSDSWNHIAGSVFVDGTNSQCVLALNGKPCTVNNLNSGTLPTQYADNSTVPWRSQSLTGFSGSVSYTPGRIAELAVWRAPKTVAELCELNRLGDGWIGRELTGMNRRRVYGFVPAGFRAYWARRQSQIIGGGVR